MKENNLNTTTVSEIFNCPSKRILFANFPADGHFNPLTGLAVYLKNSGYKVHWYASKTYTEKLKQLEITHHPFKKAKDVINNNFDEAYPERVKIKSQVKKLSYDMINAFILRAPEYYLDLLDIQKTFAFDLVICDVMFTAMPFIKQKMNVPVIAIGIAPLFETSKDLPPMGLGLTPSSTFFGKQKQNILRFIADKILFSKPTKVLNNTLKAHGIALKGTNIFDMLVHSATLMLQSGTPGFEYTRSDLSKNIQYIGPVYPLQKKDSKLWYDEKIAKYDKIVLVTQGTVEKDVSKLLIPTLEAFRNTDTLVVVATGGSGTKFLRAKYTDENFIIEDFIPFSDVMPYVDVYISNGGYGGVMLSIQNQVPMVVAGIHEGKNEICARVGYFSIGINLNTETPLPTQVKGSVEKLMNDLSYLNNIKKLSKEFNSYKPEQLCASYVADVIKTNAPKISFVSN